MCATRETWSAGEEGDLAHVEINAEQLEDSPTEVMVRKVCVPSRNVSSLPQWCTTRRIYLQARRASRRTAETHECELNECSPHKDARIEDLGREDVDGREYVRSAALWSDVNRLACGIFWKSSCCDHMPARMLACLHSGECVLICTKIEDSGIDTR